MILVVNAGSSNVKFAIFDSNSLELKYRNQVENLELLYSWLEQNNTQFKISAVGHRIVHGGTEFFAPVILTAAIIEKLKTLIPLAPLHQPYNLAAVEFLTKIIPQAVQVACFDTAFHTTQSKLAKLFALPLEYADAGILRYGFHGLSYEYVASVLPETLKEQLYSKTIVAHLGNGASMCAMQNRISIATSMGFSALDGLMMGTRTGNIDPGVLLYLLQTKGLSIQAVTDLLYKQSGLFGVSGVSNDVRILLQEQSTAAELAIDLYCYMAALNFGKLLVSLQGCDSLVFTGGVGENASIIRHKICDWLSWFGVSLDPVKNRQNETIISLPESKLVVAVIHTDEEYIIAEHSQQLVNM